MSNIKDEDDDFFADIYGEDKAKEQPKKEPESVSQSASSDPRLALLGNVDKSSASDASGAPDAVPSAVPAASEAPAAAPAPVPAAVPMADPASLPMQFDPASFSAQLAQLQQLQALANPNVAPDLSPAAQGGGFMAGKIFIPAKDEGKMFIGGLNWETTDESMKNYFSQFGEVTECMIMRDNASGRSRGFGFLTFREPRVVSAVLSREHRLDNKLIDPKRAIPREEQDKTSKIFVGGVSNDVTESDFKSFFEQYGTVIDAQLMMDKDTGRPRGFGFVTFDSENAVETIVAEQFLNLKGKPIEVKRAEPRGRDQATNDGRNGRMGFGVQQANAYGQGMDPAMMTQYYQQWQQQMSKWQEMMAAQGGGGANNPMMQAYQQAMQQASASGMMAAAPGASMPPQAPAQSHGHTAGGDDRQRRDHRRGNDERRRSRSPGYRRGGRRDHRDRDRHYNRG